MKRITVTITDEQCDRLAREARRRHLSISEIVREKLDTSAPAIPGFLGIADKALPYDASEVDEELDKTFGRA